MSLFKKFAAPSDVKMEEVKDSVGGGFAVYDTDIYKAKIKMAFLDVWGSGANYVALTLAMPDGKDYSENITITNKKGDTFYTKNDKHYPLPGFVTIDDMCLVTLGVGLSEMDEHTEEKQVMVYDKDAGKEIPKVKQVLTGLLGKEVAVAIQKSIETKMDKDGEGKYTIPTADTREANSIEKVFEPESMMTTVEARAEKTEGEFHKVWLDKNQGKTRDKTHKGESTGGKPVSAKPAGGAPQASAGAGARKPLFGNKS